MMENFINLLAVRLWTRIRTCTSRELEIFSGLEREQPSHLKNQRWTERLNWLLKQFYLRSWTSSASSLHYSTFHSALPFGPFHFPLHAPGSLSPLCRHHRFLLNSTTSSVELSPLDTALPSSVPSFIRWTLTPLTARRETGAKGDACLSRARGFQDAAWGFSVNEKGCKWMNRGSGRNSNRLFLLGNN